MAMKDVTDEMVCAADRGYVEYGVSLRTGWLTDKCRALLTQNVKSSGAAPVENRTSGGGCSASAATEG